MAGLMLLIASYNHTAKVFFKSDKKSSNI